MVAELWLFFDRHARQINRGSHVTVGKSAQCMADSQKITYFEASV